MQARACHQHAYGNAGGLQQPAGPEQCWHTNASLLITTAGSEGRWHIPSAQAANQD